MISTNTKTRTTKALLTCGVIAGPLYLIVSLLQVFTREGFDFTRHSWSLLSNGDLGWIQIANFFLAGILTIACAMGMRRALISGRGHTWGPLLIALYGVGLIGASIFVADPMNGFPVGTPLGNPVSVSTSGLMHLVSGSIGFLGLIAACFVFASRFKSLNELGWAKYSITTGVIFLLAFLGVASGAQQNGGILVFVTLSFTLAVILGWTWISIVSARLIKSL